MDLHKLASLLVRDYSIIAKRHYDMARDSSAIASTWRQVLDDTQPLVLKSDQGEDGKLGAPAPVQDSWLFVDDRNQEVS
jgi:hypothetical protein